MAGFWASWADCLPMINARHPEVVARIIAQLEGDPSGQTVQSAAESAHRLAGVEFFFFVMCFLGFLRSFLSFF